MKSCVDRFRWVIVGGGAAGCSLARRLVESGYGSVAIIEAGQATRDARTVVPAWYPRAQNTRIDWAYRTQPQSGLGGRRLAWPRGKCLGGSSAINALIYMLPARGDFERWSRQVGGHWQRGLAAIGLQLEAAAAAVNLSDEIVCPLTQLPLEPVSETHPWCRAFVEAAAAAGNLQVRAPWLRSEADICGNYWLTAKKGRRRTTASLLPNVLPMWSEPTHEDQGLTLFTGCYVHRVLIERGRAVGVELSCPETPREQTVIRAEEEIILTAGTIGSPHLLLLSGVGPANELEQCDIRCQADSPFVGRNLQDHLTLPAVLQMKTASGLPTCFGPQERKRYRDHGAGGLASNIAEVGALIGHTKLPGASTEEATHTPAVQLHVTPTHYLRYPFLGSPANCMSIAVTPLHPASRGQLRLTGAANHLSLEIDPQYLTESADAAEFISAHAWISELLSNSELGRLVEQRVIPQPHRCDEAGIMRSVRSMAQSIYHPIGTCRAGHLSSSVVDDTFRVHGVDNLRVADASTLPDLPSGNTCAATLVVAELAARIILDQPSA